MKKLAILDDFEHAALASADWARLQGKVEVAVFHDHLRDEAAIARRLADYEMVFLMRERTPFPASLFARLPKLELIVTSGLRNAAIDLDAAKQHNVVVSGTQIHSYPAAEHAWALLLALAKRIPEDDQRMRNGAWGEAFTVELRGKTLGIIGLGRLGAQVAQVGLAFGMNVIAWSENLTRKRCKSVGVRLVSKDELLEKSDFISIHLVLSDRTRGLIGAEELAAMQPSAYLINTSRGPIVDERALINALTTQTIAGAGLDVYATEPLPADHSLRSLPNTVLTPHTGYVTRENYQLFFETLVVIVDSWLEGRRSNVLGS